MGYQNFFATKLGTDIGATDTTITLETVPTVTAGRLTLEARNSTQKEIIKYTGVSGNTITGVTRGQGGTTARSHLKTALVEMNATGEDLQDILDAFNSFSASNGSGWFTGANLPTSITYNGNRNYTFQFNGVDLRTIYSWGTKVRGTRTTVAPTQGALFNGTTQYLTKTTPNKMTATDNITFGATIKVSAIPSADGYFMGRSDSSALGWGISVNNLGQIQVYAGAAGGSRRTFSYARILPGREYKIRATFAAGISTIYIDGQSVATYTGNTGTPPTAITVAGDFSIGRMGAFVSNMFAGEVSQVFYYEAILTQTQIRAMDSQGILGTETNLKSAWSLNNVLTDLNTTTPNDLTNVNTVTFQVGGGFGNYGLNASFDFGQVVSNPVFSGGNTTFNVQCPAGCTMPTTAVPLSAISYSPHDAPVGYPGRNVMLNEFVQWVNNPAGFTPTNTDADLGSQNMMIPVYVPFDCTIRATVHVGVGATADFEFRVEVRVDGVTSRKYFPNAALGSAGGRAMDRGLTADIPLTAGYHQITAGLELASGAGYSVAQGGAFLQVSVPISVMV